MKLDESVKMGLLILFIFGLGCWVGSNFREGGRSSSIIIQVPSQKPRYYQQSVPDVNKILLGQTFLLASVGLEDDGSADLRLIDQEQMADPHMLLDKGIQALQEAGLSEGEIMLYLVSLSQIAEAQGDVSMILLISHHISLLQTSTNPGVDLTF